jgi:hypothetical protein
MADFRIRLHDMMKNMPPPPPHPQILALQSIISLTNLSQHVHSLFIMLNLLNIRDFITVILKDIFTVWWEVHYECNSLHYLKNKFSNMLGCVGGSEWFMRNTVTVNKPEVEPKVCNGHHAVKCFFKYTIFSHK